MVKVQPLRSRLSAFSTSTSGARDRRRQRQRLRELFSQSVALSAVARARVVGNESRAAVLCARGAQISVVDPICGRRGHCGGPNKSPLRVERVQNLRARCSFRVLLLRRVKRQQDVRLTIADRCRLDYWLVGWRDRIAAAIGFWVDRSCETFVVDLIMLLRRALRF